MIYVDRYSKASRQESVKKMLKILNSGSSVLLYAEGGYCNSENLLVNPLFPGCYTMSKETNTPVVPIANFSEYGSDEIFIKVGEPLDLFNMGKADALRTLRDSMATMMFDLIQKHSTPIHREELSDNCRTDFMKERMLEYLSVKWSKDVWDEELTIYKDKQTPSPKDIRESFSKVILTEKNLEIFAPIMREYLDDIKYDFKRYINENWNK
jgi:hypothetical protein